MLTGCHIIIGCTRKENSGCLDIIQTAKFECNLVDLFLEISFAKVPFLKLEGLQEIPDLLAILLPSYSVKVLMPIFRLISFAI